MPPTNSPVWSTELKQWKWLRFVVDKEAACAKRVLSPMGKGIGQGPCLPLRKPYGEGGESGKH